MPSLSSPPNPLKMPPSQNNRNATIAAIATPPGVGGIAVIRLSGPEAVAIAARHCKADSGMHFSVFRDGEEVIDEVVVTLFRAPHSYTCEDTV